MELLGSMQDGATRPVTGPPLRRSPEVSDPQDPVAETRGGSLVANRAWVEAGVAATCLVLTLLSQSEALTCKPGT